jgi:hypothetical protein
MACLAPTRRLSDGLACCTAYVRFWHKADICVFKRIKGRQPITEKQPDDWLGSMEGEAATLFELTSLSRWGEQARS